MNIRKEEFIAALLALGVAGGAAGCARDRHVSVEASQTPGVTASAGSEQPITRRTIDADGNEVIVLNDDIRAIEITQEADPGRCEITQRQPARPDDDRQAVLGDTEQEGPTDE
jgi:hypothetical protein